MLANKTIAVVIPAYNEERLLPRTLARVPTFVDRVVVVDDASADATATVVAGDPRVVVCRHPSNRGVGASIVTGYRYCMDHRLDIAVVMGADDQMHPDDMPSLLLPILRGEADYVCGDRLAWPGGWREFPTVRLAGVVMLAALTRQSTGLPHIRDAQCGYTAISREALACLALDRLYPRYGFPNDMLSKAAAASVRVATRPVRPIYADETSSMRVGRVAVPILKMLFANWVERLAAERLDDIQGDVEAVEAEPASLATEA